jgi:hypothetical protein
MGPVTAYLDVNSADNGTNKDNGWLVSASAPVSGTWAVQAAYASNTVNYTAASTYTGATLVLVNDIHKQVRLYTGVKHGTVTGAADTNGYYAGLRLSF